MTRAWALLGLMIGTQAYAGYGGGGLLLNYNSPVPTPDFASRYDVPSTLNCIGGQGFRTDVGVRLGGEGMICGGPWGGESMVSGGVQVGWEQQTAKGYWGLISGLGGGLLYIPGGGTRPTVESQFLYIKPALVAGLPLGEHFALEAQPYVSINVPTESWVTGRSVVPSTYVSFGTQISLMWGNFGRRKQPLHVQGLEDIPERPAYPPPPTRPAPPPQPAPVQPSDRPPPAEQDDRPLAIPAGQPGPY